MRAGTKIWIVAASMLLLIGMILLGGAIAMVKFDFERLSTVKYETNEHTVSEAYRDISIKTKTADVVLVPHEGVETKVVCLEQTKMRHAVRVEEGRLIIEVEDTRKWYEYIGIFSVSSPKITVYLPSDAYGALTVSSDTGRVEIPSDFHFERVDISEHTGGVTMLASASGDVKIKTTTGAILVEGITAGSLELSVSTGRVTLSDTVCAGNLQVTVSTGRANLTDVRCNNLTTSGSTGNVKLTRVLAVGMMKIRRSTGDVILDGVDAAELDIETDTGDVRGSLRSPKLFDVETDTGIRRYPSTVSGGKCKIRTDTGDIEIVIE